MRKKVTPAKRVRRTETDPFEALAAAGEEALRVPITAAWRASIRSNLRLLFQHAARIDAFDLPDETEPAPVFRA